MNACWRAANGTWGGGGARREYTFLDATFSGGRTTRVCGVTGCAITLSRWGTTKAVMPMTGALPISANGTAMAVRDVFRD
jgi:hypothetical protein